MAKTFKIYTAGKMGGLTYSQQTDWRLKIEKLIKERTSANVVFIHPPLFYRYGENLHKNESEVMEWDLSQIRDSDIVVVDFEDISDSIGTHIELGFIKAINEFGNKHIFVIGIGKPNIDHPWLSLIPLRQEDTIESAADYISTYLLT